MMTILLETAFFPMLTVINLFTTCFSHTFIEVEHSAKFEIQLTNKIFGLA